MRPNSAPVGVRTEAGMNVSRRNTAFPLRVSDFLVVSQWDIENRQPLRPFQIDAYLFDWFALLKKHIYTPIVQSHPIAK
jgi:hypothetical protein